ncbi:uncharacterized protein BCR38DRAFT_385888 [Pseudomassariella vexata]|uniref:Uncharacterized protein n=1 Tax=Pseudomassariella vexata TaxID=1141098 RepID=A0A1Y2E9Y0_9PEZI|nr:uncharacterized protein BCR38DRAFT_385888 [Pseudomassariella vexata]ORY68381.1 hypothetical protein BCR38DRAFT_385888 [Pseudomassariella vexata]
MQSRTLLSLLWGFLLLALVAAQTASSTVETTPPTDTTAVTSEPDASATMTATTTGTDSSASSPTTTTATGDSGSGTSSSASSSSSNYPDVLLQVPELSVDRIELDVDDLQAEINLAAQVAGLVEINAGIQVGITKVNITIADVDAELELIIRLGNLVDIVNRTLATLDLNPLLINVLNEVTDVVDAVVGAVDGLLGSIVNGDSKINFIIDNLGNIVQEVTSDAGNILSSIIGNYEQNMTYTGSQKILDGGLIQRTYEYSPLGSLVNIVFNSVGQVVQAVVVKSSGGGSSTSSTVVASSTAAASSTSTASSASSTG